MIIEVDESFKKDFQKIKNHEIKKRIIDKLNTLEISSDIHNISNIKNMKWFIDFYRIRIWDYRIGVKIKWSKIILLRVRSRKDIYNIFP